MVKNNGTSSKEFKGLGTWEKTFGKFVKKVKIQRIGICSNPQDDVNEGFALGLLEIRYYMGRDTAHVLWLLEILQRREKRLIIEYVHVNQP